MKLRIRGNSLRFRLTDEDLDEMRNRGSIQDSIQFTPDPDARLKYCLALSRDTDVIAAQFVGNEIQILIPFSVSNPWLDSSGVGLEFRQNLGQNGELRVSIERDSLQSSEVSPTSN